MERLVTPFIAKYRTKETYLVYRYKDMKARVNGKPDGGGKNCPWLGMDICDRSDFISWAMDDSEFNKLFEQWEANGFVRSFSPTIHRIDRNRGYLLGNMKFVVHGDKSREHLAVGKRTRERKKVEVSS